MFKCDDCLLSTISDLETQNKAYRRIWTSTRIRSTMFKLVQAPYHSELFKQCQDIRMTVFVHEQGYSEEEEMDEFDSVCIHLLLVTAEEGKSVGTLRYFAPSPANGKKSQKLGRVAVMKEFRGKGCASIMLRGLEDMLQRGDIQGVQPDLVTEINCNAQGACLHQAGFAMLTSSGPIVPVVPFYKGLGYECEGEEFL